MKGKFVFASLCCALFVTLLLASCSPSGETTTPATTAPVTTAKTAQPTTAVPTSPASTRVAEKPKYGGTVTFTTTTDPTGFDQTFTIHFMAPTLNLTNESLLTGDWAKGPAGTGAQDWSIFGNIIDYENKTGCVAESYQIVEPGHMIFKIRKGIHYALNPASEASRLVNGRELTADDVVWTLKRYTTETTSYIKQSAPDMSKVIQITAPDKYTVDIQVPRASSLSGSCLTFLIGRR